MASTAPSRVMLPTAGPTPVEPVTVEMAFSHALAGEPTRLVLGDGRTSALPVHRWLGGADRGDRRLLACCVGPTVDIGCGPGRLVAELAAQGRLCLGVDVVADAVARTVDRGGVAIRRDVFSPLPGEGRWRTALLADGNIGIGGEPTALLRRVGRLVAPDGRAVVEVGVPGMPSVTVEVRLECRCGRSEPLAWSLVGADGVAAVAADAGWDVIGRHRDGDRCWVVLRRSQ